MSLSKYEFKIPDKSKPIKRKDHVKCGPWFELVDFTPDVVNAEELIGRKVHEISRYVGTYGMGGPGFFGFRLDSEWLVIAIWGAATWIQFNGRIIEEPANVIRPRFSSGREEFAPYGDAREIQMLTITRFSFEISIGQDYRYSLSEPSEDRSESMGAGRQTLFEMNVDLRKSVFLSPTGEIWI